MRQEIRELQVYLLFKIGLKSRAIYCFGAQLFDFSI